MYLIAEVGTAHRGDIETAKRLLDEVARAGFDCAKFQWVIASELLHPLSGNVTLPGGTVPLYERFLELERPAAFYAELKTACEERALDFLCAPFGHESLTMLLDLAPSALKIASPELNYNSLVRRIGESGLPVIASTGVTTLSDIAEAVTLLSPPSSATTFLHCVTAYPAPEQEYNLAALRPLSTLTGFPWGVSDHTLDPVALPLVSLVQGATILEKHVTLARDGGGLDDPIALSPTDFTEMVRVLRESQRVETNEQRLADAYDRLGRKRVEAIVGSGIKRLAPSEENNYGRTNRSLHVLHDLQAGSPITASDIAVLRTERKLSPGLHPRFEQRVIGARLVQDVSAGEGLRWEHLVAGGGENDRSSGQVTD